MDFLKNEHFAVPAVCDLVQPSLDQSPHKDSKDSGQSAVVNSSDEGINKNIHLPVSDAVDSTTPKENSSDSFPQREREGIPSSSPSSKSTVHFDKPNRSVHILCFEMHLSLAKYTVKLEGLPLLFGLLLHVQIHMCEFYART
jgi:hypothetical protein